MQGTGPASVSGDNSRFHDGPELPSSHGWLGAARRHNRAGEFGSRQNGVGAATLLRLQEDPPSSIFVNRQLSATSRARAFAPLADKKWILPF